MCVCLFVCLVVCRWVVIRKNYISDVRCKYPSKWFYNLGNHTVVLFSLSLSPLSFIPSSCVRMYEIRVVEYPSPILRD